MSEPVPYERLWGVWFTKDNCWLQTGDREEQAEDSPIAYKLQEDAERARDEWLEADAGIPCIVAPLTKEAQ